MIKKKNIYKGKLLKEIDQIKKKKIIESSRQLSNLAQLYKSNNASLENDNIHNIYLSLENNLNTINNLSNCIDDKDTITEISVVINKLDFTNIIKNKNTKYIECYSN